MLTSTLKTRSYIFLSPHRYLLAFWNIEILIKWVFWKQSVKSKSNGVVATFAKKLKNLVLLCRWFLHRIVNRFQSIWCCCVFIINTLHSYCTLGSNYDGSGIFPTVQAILFFVLWSKECQNIDMKQINHARLVSTYGGFIKRCRISQSHPFPISIGSNNTANFLAKELVHSALATTLPITTLWQLWKNWKVQS